MKNIFKTLLLTLVTFSMSYGQVTTSAINGVISAQVNPRLNEQTEPLVGATVEAVHIPSGTSYGTSTDIDGTYIIPGMRVGGPYIITVSYVGYTTKTQSDVILNLGTTKTLNFILLESN
jgi:hypothetical protein